MRPLAWMALGLVGLLAAPAAAGQVDEILLIERARDRAGRDLLARKLFRVRMDLVGTELSARDLAQRLAIAMGGELNVVAFAKGIDAATWPELEIDLRRRRVIDMLGIVTRLSDVRFVYRDGVLMLKPKDEVNELEVLRTYDLAAAVAPLRDRPGPELGLRGVVDAPFPDDGDADKTVSGFTLDTIEDLLRRHVEPDSWDADGATISRLGNALMIRQTERAHRRVATVLVRIGVWTPPPPPRVRRALRPGIRLRRRS